MFVIQVMNWRGCCGLQSEETVFSGCYSSFFPPCETTQEASEFVLHTQNQTSIVGCGLWGKQKQLHQLFTQINRLQCHITKTYILRLSYFLLLEQRLFLKKSFKWNIKQSFGSKPQQTSKSGPTQLNLDWSMNRLRPTSSLSQVTVGQTLLVVNWGKSSELIVYFNDRLGCNMKLFTIKL